MKKRFLILFLTVGTLLSAQNDKKYVETLLTDFSTKLEQRGIRDYFSVEKYCMGNVQMFTMSNGSLCTSKGTYTEVYLFWTEDDGSSWVKKFDNCGLFLSVELKKNEIHQYAEENVSGLKSGSVKRFETENMNSGRPALRTEIHNCLQAYRFTMGGETFEQKFNELDLAEGTDERNGDKNLNYNYNKGMPVVALSNLCNNLLEELNTKGQFKRQ